MAKLVFVTGDTATGKTQYIKRDRRADSIVIDEVGYRAWGYSVDEIHRHLARGTDVYVSWILPEGAEIQIVTEQDR